MINWCKEIIIHQFQPMSKLTAIWLSIAIMQVSALFTLLYPRTRDDNSYVFFGNVLIITFVALLMVPFFLIMFLFYFTYIIDTRNDVFNYFMLVTSICFWVVFFSEIIWTKVIVGKDIKLPSILRNKITAENSPAEIDINGIGNQSSEHKSLDLD